jgi:Tfp pilus assembly PilM family ATPase
LSARTFGALVAHDGVCLVEYSAEKTGIRVVSQWASHERSASIDQAAQRLATLIAARGVRRPKLALAVEQFGVVHHTMTLPAAADEVLRPIVEREMQRLFGLTDASIAFSRGVSAEQSDAPRNMTAAAAPTQLFIAATPRDTIDAIYARLISEGVDVEIATVVPKAIHSLYQATGASNEPTAVLVCLEGGPHLAFFIDGRLELAIDPPIALEGERAPISVILDQVERGAVYFRQQFRGATATRMLLAAPADEFQALSAALEERLRVRVSPLYPGDVAPEAVVAMGAVLEARQSAPLDFYPHPPTFTDRMRTSLRGPNGAIAAVGAAAVITGIWAGMQFLALSSTRAENERLRNSIRGGVATVEPMRQVAERRADYVHSVSFIDATNAERQALTSTLRGIADAAPTGVRFDTLRVSRAANGWSGQIAGEAVGATAAQAAGALDVFYQSIRRRAGISAATLDEFEYPVVSGPDSTKRSAGPVVINFKVSFAIARAEGSR